MTGEVLASRIRLVISSGLVDLNKLIKQATVRRHIVLRLIQHHIDAGEKDYLKVNMDEVRERMKE